MQKSLKSLGRGALWVVEVFVRMFLLRPNSSREPFQKAERWEWRIGCLFVAILPAFMVIGVTICEKIPDSVANSFFNTGFAPVLLWAGFVIFVSVGVFSLFKFGQKIPLSVSIPIATVTWPICAWYFIAQYLAT
jgi:hypothetical protein